MRRLVASWGRTGFALATTSIWFLPMAIWAGTVDLYPGPLPWLAFGFGLVMLGVWIGAIAWARRVPVPPGRRRFDLAQMSSAERAWLAGFAACAMILVGWLNAAATVDVGGLVTALPAHRPGVLALTAALLALLIASVGGAATCWRRAFAAFRNRR